MIQLFTNTIKVLIINTLIINLCIGQEQITCKQQPYTLDKDLIELYNKGKPEAYGMMLPSEVFFSAEMQHVIARAALRNINEQTKKIVVKYYQYILTVIDNTSTEALTELWKRIGNEARCDLVDINNPYKSTGSQLKDLVKYHQIANTSYQDMISIIESITTMLAYGFIQNYLDHVHSSISTKDPLVQKTIKNSYVYKTLWHRTKYIPRISSAITDREAAFTTPNHSVTEDIIHIPAKPREPVNMSISTGYIPSGVPDTYFKVNSNWIQQALKSCIPVRNHVSNSLPLALSSLEAIWGLFNDDSTKTPDLDMQTLSALFIASYLRGDYHTFAESMVGIQYYSYIKNDLDNEYQKSIINKFKVIMLDPVQAEKQAILLLSDIVDYETRVLFLKYLKA